MSCWKNFNKYIVGTDIHYNINSFYTGRTQMNISNSLPLIYEPPMNLWVNIFTFIHQIGKQFLLNATNQK